MHCTATAWPRISSGAACSPDPPTREDDKDVITPPPLPSSPPPGQPAGVPAAPKNGFQRHLFRATMLIVVPLISAASWMYLSMRRVADHLDIVVQLSEADHRARAHPVVRQVLGQQIRAGWMRKVSIDTRDGLSTKEMQQALLGDGAEGLLTVRLLQYCAAEVIRQRQISLPGISAPVDLGTAEERAQNQRGLAAAASCKGTKGG